MILRISVFILICWNIIAIIDVYALWEVILLPCIIGSFILMAKTDAKLYEKQKLYKAQIRCCLDEIEYLTGDFSNLVKGEQYMSIVHPYSHDLDIFGDNSLYQSINRTATRRGSDRLAEILSKTIPEKKETIVGRQEAAEEMTSKTAWCLLFRATGRLYPITDADNLYIEKWRKEKLFFSGAGAKYLIYSSNALLAILILTAVIIPHLYILPISLFTVQLAIAIGFTKKINIFQSKLGRFISSISNYFHIIDLIAKEEFSSSLLSNLKKCLFHEKEALKAFQSLKNIYSGLENRNNIPAFILLNGCYMKDLLLMMKMDCWKKEYINDISGWIEALSEIDALISLATYRFNHPDYTVPVIFEETVLNIKAAGHPLIFAEHVITNDFRIGSMHEFHIITGANMAGKSTFLRTVGINMVLAYSGSVVCAKKMSLSTIPLFTSMRTTDNLARGTSYFHAELLRLKQLVDTATERGSLFIILDEMLKGTNSLDKLNGSVGFLRKLTGLPISGIIATHDLALGRLSENYPDNFINECFEIEHTEEGIHYDYKLKEGVSRNMNASILLDKMGLIS